MNIITKLGMSAAMLTAAMIAFSGCSSNHDTPYFTTTSSKSLGKTAETIGNSIYSDEVVTDGNWLVWEGRQQRFIFNNGTGNIDLGSKLGTKYSLGTDNDSWRNILFDGRRLLFAADDITDSAPPQIFMYDTSAMPASPVKLGSITTANNIDYLSASLDNGVAAWIMDNPSVAGQRDLFYYNANAVTPTVMQLTDNAAVESQITVSGNFIAWISNSDGEIYTADISATTVTATKLTSSGVSKSALQGKGGLLAWQEGTAVYYSNGTTVSQATADGNTDSISWLTTGSGNIAWQQGTSIVYRAAADAAKTVNPVATGLSYSLEGLAIGDNIVSWSRNTTGSTREAYLYSFGNAADSATTISSIYSYQDLGIKISGKKLFWIQDMKGNGSTYPIAENPSCYLYTYDSAATTPAATKVAAADYMRITTFSANSGKVVWSGHDANRRLYATKANDLGTPVAITPASVNATQPVINNGIVAYKGMDRAEMDGTYDGSDQDIYYANLNQSGWPITRVTENFFEDDKPFISGNIITWRTTHRDTNSTSADEVNFYNISSKATHTMTSKSGDAVRTDGRYVIWRDLSNQLYYYDTAATTPVETAVSGATALNKCANIIGGVLTWIRYTGTDYRIYYMDLNSATPAVTEVAVAVNGQAPQTDGRFIVWGGDSGGSSSYSIYYYDTKAATPVATEITATYKDQVCIPRLSNGVVVFAAVKYGDVDSTGTDREVFTVNLKAVIPTVVQLTDNDLWDSNPDVANGVVTWRTGGGDNWDWQGKITAAMRL